LLSGIQGEGNSLGKDLLKETTRILVSANPYRVEVHSTNLLFSNRLRIQQRVEKTIFECTLDTTKNPYHVLSDVLDRVVQHDFDEVQVHLTFEGKTWEMSYKRPSEEKEKTSSRFERMI
jgi:hypothetical protein